MLQLVGQTLGTAFVRVFPILSFPDFEGAFMVEVILVSLPCIVTVPAAGFSR